MDCRLMPKMNEAGLITEHVRDPEFTGYFRDGVRKIDLILVMKDRAALAIDQIKVEFLMSVINTGLELEIESGVELLHTSLLFIKVHASDKIIEEYGGYFDTYKHFKTSHLEYMKPDPYVADTLLTCLKLKHEKEWVRELRVLNPGPPYYTTMERSNVVYRILMTLPFGAPENFYNLHSLLEKNIVLDAYPLHDGPYYVINNKNFNRFNGRQALFYCWVGYRHLPKSQPVHLIREYLGERIAFLFAFFQFYNRALLLSGIVGLMVFLFSFVIDPHALINLAGCTKENHKFATWHSFAAPELYTHRYIWTSRDQLYRAWEANQSRWIQGVPVTYAYVTWYFGHSYTASYIDHYNISYFHIYSRTKVAYNYSNIDYEDLPVCPKCRNFNTCPFRNLTQYCDEVKIKNWIDNPNAIYYSLFISVWAIVFYLCWRRKENYYQWIWEVNEKNAVNTLRPEFKIVHKESALHTIVKLWITLRHFVLRLGLTALVIVGYILVIVPLMVAYKYYLLNLTQPFDDDWNFLVRTYVILAVVAMTNAVVIILLDELIEVLSYKFAGYLNYRTEDDYELSLVVKLYGFSFMINFSLFFYFAFLKGQFYTYPSDPNRWYFPLGLGVMNCGLLSCIDEVWLTFVVTCVSKKVFKEAWSMFKRYKTDYNRGKIVNSTVPCWEKEYSLYRLDEKIIMNIYKNLMIQFALATTFVFIFPLAPFLAYLMNQWDMRYLAELMLVRSRRPLLLKTWGLGAWRIILFGLPYVAAICNALTIALNSNLIDSQVHQKYFNRTRYFADFAMGVFNTSDYGLVTGNSDSPAAMFSEITKKWVWQVHFCLFPGKWNRMVESFVEKRVFDNSYTQTMSKWYVNWYQACFFLIFLEIVVIIALLLHYFVKPCPKDIEETVDLEHALRTYATSGEAKKDE